MAIAILGGGISGLTLAWNLQRAGLDYDLFEASARPGGTSARSSSTATCSKPAPTPCSSPTSCDELLHALGLTASSQDAAAVSQNRYVLRQGAYQKLPASPPALLTSPFFSLKGPLEHRAGTVPARPSPQSAGNAEPVLHAAASVPKWWSTP